MYKMITIDVDDTLITDDLVVTDGTKQALAKAIDKGVIVTLATGRMYASAKKIATQIELNVPLITYQGAYVKNLMDGTVLYERFVPKHIAQYLFEYSEKNGYHLQTYYNDELFVKEDNERVQDYAKTSNIPYSIEPDLEKLVAKPMTKMLMVDEPDLLDKIAEELKPLIGNEVHITKSKPHFLEFMHKEGTKGHALRYLANHFGVDTSEVIAIGDSWNDREMLEAAGLGVAMDNAVQELKDIADYITLSNNNEGVKHVIEKFVL